MADIHEMEEYILDLEEELENLTEQNRLLVERIRELEKDSENHRVCDVCGKKMSSGYLVDDSEYYCSAGCLHSIYSPKEYMELFKNNAAYWTEWDE